MMTKVKTLQTILNAEAFILTGSLALQYLGLTDKADDIDLILVNPTESARTVLDSLQEAEPSPKFRKEGPVDYSFFFEGVKVDVWVEKECGNGLIIKTEEGIRLANVNHIVRAKKTINRPKDWISLMQIAKRIYDPIEFAKALPSISGTDY